eukprot:COSAG05_NODE_6_length_45604_cov_26.489660_6_plen_42_part_00
MMRKDTMFNKERVRARAPTAMRRTVYYMLDLVLLVHASTPA